MIGSGREDAEKIFPFSLYITTTSDDVVDSFRPRKRGGRNAHSKSVSAQDVARSRWRTIRQTNEAPQAAAPFFHGRREKRKEKESWKGEEEEGGRLALCHPFTAKKSPLSSDFPCL